MKNDNIVLIIGNGFNLDLKFESKYSDFAKSEEWKELYEKYASKSNHYSLIKFLNDRKETDKWFDIEQALFEYAALKTADIWHHDVSNDIQEYHALCRQLEKYFTNKISRYTRDISNTVAGILLNKLQHVEHKVIYSFNFTSIDWIRNITP